MSEYRQDPLSRRWVIVGCDDRAERPNEFVEAITAASAMLTCPFCAGNETETPPAIATYRLNGKGTWLVRVVPNKYPAVTAKPTANARMQPLPATRRQRGSRLWPARGHHRVAPARRQPQRADRRRSELVFSPIAIACAIWRGMADTDTCRSSRTSGPAAGASLEHVHSQLIALPGVPEVVEQELTACAIAICTRNVVVSDMIWPGNKRRRTNRPRPRAFRRLLSLCQPVSVRGLDCAAAAAAAI